MRSAASTEPAHESSTAHPGQIGYAPAMERGRSDLLVIGAGPAGAAAGIVAARRGLKVCVVDRSRFPRPKTCGDAVSSSAAGIVAELGAAARFEQAPRARVDGATAIFPDGTRVSRSYAAAPGWIVARLHLDDLLRRALEESGARVVEGVAARALRWSGSRCVGADGGALDWRADAVICADGAGSLAWTALGRRAPRGRALAISLTAYYSGLRPAQQPGFGEHYFEAELPAGYGWIFPEVGGHANVGVYQRADRYHRADASLAELLERFVARHPERFDGARREGRTRAWQLPLAAARPPDAAPGLATSGDAGCLVDPLSGEGIYQALASGRIAGEAVARALAGRHGFDAGAARRYRFECARAVGWPSARRIAVQQAMELLVGLELYRHAAVRAALEWGYRRGATEVSKAFQGT
jgi:geranylgeranyl reductase family protein